VSLPNIKNWYINKNIDKSWIITNCLSIIILPDNNQLKNVELISDDLKENFKKNQNEYTKKELSDKILIAEFVIKSNDINHNVILFNKDINFKIDVYLYDTKINITRANNKWEYNFQKEGKYRLTIIFN